MLYWVSHSLFFLATSIESRDIMIEMMVLFLYSAECRIYNVQVTSLHFWKVLLIFIPEIVSGDLSGKHNLYFFITWGWKGELSFILNIYQHKFKIFMKNLKFINKSVTFIYLFKKSLRCSKKSLRFIYKCLGLIKKCVRFVKI